MDTEEVNASIQHSSIAADSLMPTDFPQSPGYTLDEEQQPGHGEGGVVGSFYQFITQLSRNGGGASRIST